VEHGEFPFELRYEIDGTEYEVKDTLICDFDGYGFSEGSGAKFRKWTSRLESGETRITLLETEDGEIYFNPGLGSEKYYMSDPDNTFSGNTTFADAAYTSDFDNREVVPRLITAEEMYEKYKIRLTHWEIAPPIENTFK